MKYLKYINESSNKDEFYVKISNQEYSDLINNNREIFNKRERDFFNNNTNVDYWVKRDSYYYHNVEFKPTDKFDKSHMVVLKYYYEGTKIINSNINTYITKLEDNYYAVYNENVYQKLFYKCDQFEGLVQLLKDKELI